MIRVAATADLHCREDRPTPYRKLFEPVSDEADVFVVAGDLTHFGRLAEAASLAAELGTIRVPVVAVLGNHDHHSDEAEGVKAVLREEGIHVLEDGPCRLQVNGHSVGFAGTKGFGGGFGNTCLTPFGEMAIKAFISETTNEVNRLEQELRSLASTYRVAVLHYAPVRETLAGESPELYPFLGSSLLSGPLDSIGADLVLHGHAHHGTEVGKTEKGIPVRNVAMPVLRRPYVVYELGS